MTSWDKWSLLGAATGVTDQHGLGLTPMPGPDEAMISICAEDGARAHAVISKAALVEDGIMPSLLAGLEAGQAETRAAQDEYRARREAG